MVEWYLWCSTQKKGHTHTQKDIYNSQLPFDFFLCAVSSSNECICDRYIYVFYI